MSTEKNRKILVTSDIHGCLEHLKAVLKKANFCKDDVLIVIGDMLEKGPCSLGTLRYVMELCKQGNAVATIGNVDYYRLLNIYHTVEHEENALPLYNYIEWIRDWKGTCFYDELLSEIGFSIESKDDVVSGMKKIIEHFKDELDFLRSLPTVIETDQYVFVHGGLPHLDDEFELTPDSIKDPSAYLKFDMFLTKTLEKGMRFKRNIVCGHWPVANYGEGLLSDEPIFDNAARIISIDGGCGVQRDGQLNLLVFPSLDCQPCEIKNISYDGLPTVNALERQHGSTVSSKVVWNDNDVTLIERKDDLLLVEQISTKKRFWVTEDMIWSTDKSGLKTSKCTDHLLDVSEGDELSVVKITSRGLIAKKNGVIGWYNGKYE